MRIFLVLLFSLTLVPCGWGQQKAKINCINAKSAPLLDPTLAKVTGWIKCGDEVRVIALQPDGGFYLIEAEIAGQTMRGNIDKAWLKIASPPPGQLASDPPSFLPAITPPSIIGSTYPISYPVTSAAMRARGVKTIRKTIHLHEEEDQLAMDVGWPEGNHTSRSIEYGKVNLVRVVSSKNKTEHTVDIELADGASMLVPVQTDAAAKELAEYVASKSSHHLELIGDAWRVRKPFLCPESVQTGCRDFKELLEHDDADIVDSFYSGTESYPHYACFSDSSRRFFTLSYNLPSEFYKGGFFFQNIFIEGQSNSENLVATEWTSDDYANLLAPSASNRGGKQSTGYITQSELTYQQKFTNRNGTETQYSLSIRWSTGRYIETFSSKDDKGKPISDDQTGICVKLN